MAELHDSYAAVLADMRERRVRLGVEIRELDNAIASLERLANLGTHRPPSPPATVAQPAIQHGADEQTEGNYARISVRWAVLWHLTEFSARPEKTGEITDALTRGGYVSQAGKFGNFVSAVLSTMKAKGEVQTTEDGGFFVTDSGRQTWRAIKQGVKFREATASTAPPPPSTR